jgi:hypothetical protein
MKRAGATILITYHALDAAKWLKEECFYEGRKEVGTSDTGICACLP